MLLAAGQSSRGSPGARSGRTVPSHGEGRGERAKEHKARRERGISARQKRSSRASPHWLPRLLGQLLAVTPHPLCSAAGAANVTRPMLPFSCGFFFFFRREIHGPTVCLAHPINSLTAQQTRKSRTSLPPSERYTVGK